MRTSIWLVRHAQTVANREQRYQSHTDTPLTDYGQRQSATLAHRLRRIPLQQVVVSPAARTRTTAAALLADRSLLVQPIVAPAWAETHHGRWEGLTYREVLARFPNEARERFADTLHGRAQGGESLAEVAARVAAGWRDLLHQFPGGRILVVTHATPIKLILCALTGMPISQHWQWRIDLGSITALDVYASGAIIRTVNEVPRL
ncbi:MAG: histidine phosphatase family protein [Chloroflexaceae bacterium]|nr:histidine phosphatase family protein [Chloroflexaceae bacterium]NJO07184.1 histidine phosphatase family protein [Chloroflexaceae bacterium]